MYELQSVNRQKNIPEAVAVNVAQVPVVYQVPALIKHPSTAPLYLAFQ